MDLRSRLEMYSGKNAGKGFDYMEESRKEPPEVLNGSLYRNVDGECVVLEERLPSSYLYGGYPVGKAIGLEFDPLCRLFPGLAGNECVSDFIFLDTETTGLSGGTGTLVFLVGTGFFQGNEFVLRQYFIRDYDEEPAMLRELGNLLSDGKGLVTFNGKAFDWNLLTTRFMFNRLPQGMEKVVHLDLLYPSRMLWKGRLQSCRLVSLEENILGEYRVDDIPGEFIPSVYFRYLEDRDPTDIKRVLKHNRSDILSMVSLLIKIHAMVTDPLDETECEEELLGLGRVFFKCGEYENAIRCLESCSEWGKDYLKDMASMHLSMAYKRRRDYSRAVAHWKNMLKEETGMKLHPMIELAKYYEHRKKDIGAALEITESAMELTREMGEMENALYLDLQKRAERLRRKNRRKKDA